MEELEQEGVVSEFAGEKNQEMYQFNLLPLTSV